MNEKAILYMNMARARKEQAGGVPQSLDKAERIKFAREQRDIRLRDARLCKEQGLTYNRQLHMRTACRWHKLLLSLLREE